MPHKTTQHPYRFTITQSLMLCTQNEYNINVNQNRFHNYYTGRTILISEYYLFIEKRRMTVKNVRLQYLNTCLQYSCD